MAETKPATISDVVGGVRERLGHEVSAQAEQLGKLEQAVQELRAQHKKLEEAVQQQLEMLKEAEGSAPASGGGEGALENVLGSVRNLITATYPEQVLEVLTEEAEQMGVRSAVFDVRGKSAWGAAARGFGSALNEKQFRGLIIPLNQDNPFRTVFETGAHADTNADGLKKNRNVLDKFKPSAKDPILLLPIRSAGSVSAIFYADAGGKSDALPVDGLKILGEFAGAQLDRLMALSGGVPAEAAAPEAAEAEAEVVEAEAAEVETIETEPAEQAANAAAASAPEAVPEPPPPPPPAPAAVDVSKLSEEEQKIHKDAKRFAKLLVSEIELYNKAKVADGRKNKDIYKRLKVDIERSRQTYEKRFGKTAAKQFDYFHDEIVRTLGTGDAAVLGSDYPGPSS